jgi:hypothetical protein
MKLFCHLIPILPKIIWLETLKNFLIMFDQQECWNNQGSLYPNKVTRPLKLPYKPGFPLSGRLQLVWVWQAIM